MSAWLAAKLGTLWAKFSGWIVLIGVVLGAMLAAFLTGKHKGEMVGIAEAAKQAIADARAAQQTTIDAAKAVDQVRADAAKQPPPNTDKRDDLDNTF